MRRVFRTLAIVAALLACGALAHGATYVVDQATGSDAAAGSEAAPWKTLTKGFAALKAGDTLIVKAGVYRESVTVKALGTAEAPITIKAAPGERVVVSGADQIASWKPSEEHGKSIYYADIPWVPTAVFENGKEQMLARTPNEGWWPTTKADATTITDPVHLTQKSDAWTGATLFFFRYKGVTQTRKPVKSFDPATHTITLGEPLSTNTRVKYTHGSDRYRLENKVSLIDQPGEWAFEKRGTGARVYYRPHAADIAKTLIEIPRRKRIVSLTHTAYCTIDGLEIVHAIHPGRTADAAIGNDVSKSIKGAGQKITIRNCTIHHNGRFAFFGRGYKDLRIINNLVYRNQYGISISSLSDVLVEGNEIAENLVDGLLLGGDSHDVIVRRNYIHHHNLFGHPDNIQLHSGVNDVTFEDNLILSAGQSVMMEKCDRITFRNNVVAGSAANMMIMGHGNATNGVWHRNTFALWASSLFSLTAQDYEITGNIMVNNGGAIFYGIPAKGRFVADGNLWWRVPGVAPRLGGMKGEGGRNVWFSSLEDIRDKSGQERTSVMTDPQFKNAPLACTTLDNKKIGDCTRGRLFVRRAALFAVGDIVEVHFDGVVRKVTAIDGNTLTVDPPLSETPDRVMFVANWKDKSDLTLDYSSPMNDKYGSTINVPAYLKGDFDGDGKRDVPVYR